MTHCGAWEVASRLSWLDLTDNDVRGGTIGLLNFGLNGYLTETLCVRFSYGFGQIRETEKAGDIQILQLRLQWEL